MAGSQDYLQRFVSLHPRLIDLSLGRIERLLERLGHPETKLPPVIHVAGTNGKGSTVAFMRGVLDAAGLVVHAYTSPHLVNFHERIRIGRPGGGELVDEDRLTQAFGRCEEANDGAPITLFEITTAAALMLFADHPAHVLLLEVGLGGRCDATNVIKRPLVTVVTPVSLDHSEYLGDTVAKIAVEKAGIFRPGVPAVIAPQDHGEAEQALEREARRVGAPLFAGGQDFHVQEEQGRLVYQDEAGLLDLPLPRLAGRHQHVNAGTALAALRRAGFGRLPVAAFETGIGKAEWPARLQLLTRGALIARLPTGTELWLDGGHNADGGRALAAALAECEERSPRPLLMIVGMLATKDAAGFLEPFGGLAVEVLAVPVSSSAATRPPAEVAAIAAGLGIKATALTGLDAAMSRISARHWPEAPRVLICGSLYLAGEVLAANGTPPR